MDGNEVSLPDIGDRDKDFRISCLLPYLLDIWDMLPTRSLTDFLVGPVFKESSPILRKEHDPDPCRVEITSQHGNRDRSHIEDLDFQFSSCKLSDSL